MKNIKLTIEYDGTNYGGWQKQKNNSTIQEEIERAIYSVTGEKLDIIGSSRTDAGVHARGMVANFVTNSSVPPNRFREAINTKLPDDIGIVKSEEVDMDFHARYLSKGKTYCYNIINRKEKVCIERNYAYHVKEDINISDMKEACKYFIGKHDFSAFRTTGSSVKSTIRTISDLHMDVFASDFETKITLYVTANGFLYNMVRIIAGTLIDVGRGKIDKNRIEAIIKSGDRRLSGHCAPACGLTLLRVYY